jgi:hypothetical protein
VYQTGGFAIEGDQLHLELPEGTLTSTLIRKYPLAFLVGRIRVYRFAKDGHFYGTFAEPAPVKTSQQAEPKPRCIDDDEPMEQPVPKGLMPVRKVAVGTSTSKGYDLKTIRAAMRETARRTQERDELAHLRQALIELGNNQLEWFQCLADQLDEQREEIAALRTTDRPQAGDHQIGETFSCAATASATPGPRRWLRHQLWQA